MEKGCDGVKAQVARVGMVVTVLQKMQGHIVPKPCEKS